MRAEPGAAFAAPPGPPPHTGDGLGRTAESPSSATRRAAGRPPADPPAAAGHPAEARPLPSHAAQHGPGPRHRLRKLDHRRRQRQALTNTLAWHPGGGWGAHRDRRAHARTPEVTGAGQPAAGTVTARSYSATASTGTLSAPPRGPCRSACSTPT